MKRRHSSHIVNQALVDMCKEAGAPSYSWCVDEGYGRSDVFIVDQEPSRRAVVTAYRLSDLLLVMMGKDERMGKG